MKRIAFLAAVACGSFLLFGAQSALAASDPGCTALGGTDGAGTCFVTGAHSVPGPATITVGESLELQSTAVITVTGLPVTASALTLNVTGSSFQMDKNSAIRGGGRSITINVPNGDMTMLGTAGAVGDKCGYPNLPSAALGADITSTPAVLVVTPFFQTTITINVGNYPNNVTPSGSFLMERCSLVDASNHGTGGSSGSAGAVVITAGHDADLDGQVLSESLLSGTSPHQAPGGGPITVQIGCQLTVSDSGVVSSKGSDPGADLVHLEGCDTAIDGLVQSTGAGHSTPDNPPNHCATGVHAGKDPNSTGCVEIIGQNITISNTGEVNANVSSSASGGPSGTSWIDMYAYDSFFLTGRTAAAASFLVHANSLIGSDTSPNIITVVAQNGGLTGSGKLFQASDTANGSNGGTINITTFGSINLTGNTPTILAQGHNGVPSSTNACSAGGSGSCGKGGFITLMAVGTGSTINWLSGIGNVNPDVAGGTHTGFGVITLLACVAPTTTGTNFGNATLGVNLIVGTTACTAAPLTVPPYIQAAFNVGDPIWDACTGFTAHKSGHKFDDPVGDGTLGAPIQGWPINLLTTANVVLKTVFTDVNGFYQFDQTDFGGPGTFRVCEGQKAGVTSTETFPKASTVHPGETVITTCPGPNKIGYEFTIVNNSNFTDDDFANHTTTTNQECKKQTAIDIMNNAFPGNLGPDVTVHAFAPLNESVQNAVDTVTDSNHDGYLIIMVIAHADGSLGGTTNQKVVVSKDYFNDANPDIGNKPFGLFGCSVTMTGGGPNFPAIWIQDTAQGKETTINGHKSTILVSDLHGGNSAWGLLSEGTERYIRNEQPTGNGFGIEVFGDGNTVHNGVVQNSSQYGLAIVGNNNFVTDTRVYTSTLDGVIVAGDNNWLQKLLIGDIGKGNDGDGLHILSGNGNTLQENTSRSNGKDGFHIETGTGNTLTKNVSGGTASQDNGDCEYDVVAGNINGGENKANNVTIAGPPPAAFPTGCIGTP